MSSYSSYLVSPNSSENDHSDDTMLMWEIDGYLALDEELQEGLAPPPPPPPARQQSPSPPRTSDDHVSSSTTVGSSSEGVSKVSMNAAAANNCSGGKGIKIAFRTKSEVEILDDGYKWRKYGKKMVKSSPNPRNYYRCINEGCNVKKRVEREQEDSSYVITTYEGIHNHQGPSHATYHHRAHASPEMISS